MRLIASSDPLLGVVAVLLVVGSLWLAVTRNTAFALAAYMLYLGLLDGYFKLGTGNSNVTLVRDALLYAVVAGLLIKAAVRGTPLRLPPLSTWVVMFVVIVLVAALHRGAAGKAPISARPACRCPRCVWAP